MRIILAALLLLAVPASAQIVGAGNRKVFTPAGGIAIAFDNASNLANTAGATTLTYAFSVGSGGTNRLMFVGVDELGLVTPTVTYAGAAMTLVKSATYNFGTAENFLFVLVAPATGSNNVVITVTTAARMMSAASSYTGALQSATMDNSASNNTAGTTATATLTTVANNCWTVAWSGVGTAVTVSAGAGSTLRSNATQVSAIFDSNGPKTPAGSTSMTVNFSATAQQSSLMVSFTHA